jgi:hypothetical protein
VKIYTNNSDVTVNLNGSAYKFTNAHDVANFKADMGWFASVEELVAKYLSKLQRVFKAVSAIVRMALELADADNYRRGIGAATLQDARRYL